MTPAWECKERINIGEYLVKYCILPIGHKGKHRSEDDIELKTKRCQSKNSDGIQCGLPHNHKGKHSVASNITRSWS